MSTKFAITCIIGSTALASTARAATCSSAGGSLSVNLAGETATLKTRTTDGAILLNKTPCGGATLQSIDQIQVWGSAGAEQLTITDGVAQLRISIDLGSGTDSVTAVGSAGVDQLILGSEGLEWTGDGVVDATMRNVETVVLSGGDGDDFLSGAGGGAVGGPYALDLSIYGNGGNDTLLGGHGPNRLNGSEGDDVIIGGPLADQLRGGPGVDYESGEGGDDRFNQGSSAEGDDVLEGGAGADTVAYDRTNSVYVSLDDLANDGEAISAENDNVGSDIEIILGGDGDDFLIGSDGPTSMFGRDGSDIIQGRSGADLIYGGVGDDFIWGEDGNDWIAGGPGNDLIAGGSGDDSLDGEDGVDELYGEDGRDRLYGGAAEDHLDGGAGLDNLFCGSGADTAMDEDNAIGSDCELNGPPPVAPDDAG